MTEGNDKIQNSQTLNEIQTRELSKYGSETLTTRCRVQRNNLLNHVYSNFLLWLL